MLLRLYNKNNNPKDLEEVIRILEEGGLIIYPTDTMYAHRMSWSERTCNRTYLQTEKH